MALLNPLDMGERPELHATVQGARAAMGFVPNSMLTMAHVPQLPSAFSFLANVIFGGDLRMLVPTAPEPGDVEQNLEPALIQLVGVILLFGFFNRWNDTVATELEAAPVAFAESSLGTVGWTPGKHGPPAGRL